MPRKYTTEERASSFWSGVDMSAGATECWPWTRATQGNGYGKVKVGGKMFVSSRYAWILTNGDIPTGQCVMHSCDNPPCCNPAHLSLGTMRDNQLDMATKNRVAFGERSPNATITAADAVAIRESVRNGESLSSIARRYGFARGNHVRRIANGERWARAI